MKKIASIWLQIPVVMNKIANNHGSREKASPCFVAEAGLELAITKENQT
jgi:hypothetical protein